MLKELLLSKPIVDGFLLLPLLGKPCRLLSCSVRASLPKLAGAGRIALMGLAAASKEGLGFGLLFSSCPLGAAARASILKDKKCSCSKSSTYASEEQSHTMAEGRMEESKTNSYNVFGDQISDLGFILIHLLPK